MPWGFFGRERFSTGNLEIAITQASSLLRRETLPIYYSTNTFWLYESGGTSLREVGNLQRWLGRRVTAQYSSYLSHVLVPAVSLPPHSRPVGIGSLRTQLEQLVRMILRGVEWQIPFEALLEPLKTSFTYESETLALVKDQRIRKEVMDSAVDALVTLTVDARWAQGDQAENEVLEATLRTWLSSLSLEVRASYQSRNLYLPRRW